MGRKDRNTEYPVWPTHRILYTSGDCFNHVKPGMNYILNPANNIGSIETEVFYTIDMKWPTVYQYYKSQPLLLGTVHFTHVSDVQTIVTMIVQDQAFDAINRVDNVSYTALYHCFTKLLYMVPESGVFHITKPRVRVNIAPWSYPLGNWDQIAKIIDNTLIKAKSTVYAYKP